MLCSTQDSVAMGFRVLAFRVQGLSKHELLGVRVEGSRFGV